MSIRDVVNKVEAAVRAAEANGQTAAEAAYEVTRDLPIADMKAVHAHITDGKK